eukprot:2711619-Amphidinium_carterae.1
MASDAEMAYIQATLQGIKTWVRLPKDQLMASLMAKNARSRVSVGASTLWTPGCWWLLGETLREASEKHRLRPSTRMEQRVLPPTTRLFTCRVC